MSGCSGIGEQAIQTFDMPSQVVGKGSFGRDRFGESKECFDIIRDLLSAPRCQVPGDTQRLDGEWGRDFGQCLSSPVGACHCPPSPLRWWERGGLVVTRIRIGELLVRQRVWRAWIESGITLPTGIRQIVTHLAFRIRKGAQAGDELSGQGAQGECQTVKVGLLPFEGGGDLRRQRRGYRAKRFVVLPGDQGVGMACRRPIAGHDGIRREGGELPQGLDT